MPKLETKPLEWLKPEPEELARHDDPEETRRLGQDMLALGQLQPVAATEDGKMIFGHGRYLAAKSAGIKTLEVKIYPAMDDTQFILTRVSENLQRKELTGWRKYLLFDGLIKLNGWDQKTLAEKIHLDPSSVTRLLSPARCSADWQAALREGKVSISDCYAASKLPPDNQPGLLSLKLGGASRDDLETAGRKKRAATAPAVRASKIKVPLVSGAVVTVAGDEITLEDAIEAAGEAIKNMKAALSKGLNAKTAMNVWRDVAAAG